MSSPKVNTSADSLGCSHGRTMPGPSSWTSMTSADVSCEYGDCLEGCSSLADRLLRERPRS